MLVQDLINAALRSIEAIAPGEGPTSAESADALLAINDILASWSASTLPIFTLTRETFALTGAGSYTIGPAMTWNTTRPVKLEAAAVVTGTGVSKPAKIVPVEEWTEFADKAATGNFASSLYFDDGYPTGTIFLAPKPTGGTLELYS